MIQLPRTRRQSITLIAVAICICMSWATLASAQLFERATVLKNARILTMDGREYSKGTLVLKGGEVHQIGVEVKAPLLSKTLDLSGKVISPGLIDVHSGLALTRSSASARASAKATEAFDHYAMNQIESVLAQGITAIYIPAGAAQGIHGVGAVIRLTKNPHGGFGSVEVADSALCIDFASQLRNFSRIRLFQTISGQFSAALRYRERLEENEVALEDYEKDLKEYAEKAKAAKEKEEKRKKEKNGKAAGKKKPIKGDKKKELKAPTKPPTVALNIDNEVLLRALDREFPVRIHAESNADIQNAIDLQQKFGFDLILEGAAEAGLLAKPLKEINAKIILGLQENSMSRNPFEHAAKTAKQLQKAEIKMWCGTAGASSKSSGLLLNAQIASSRGAFENPLRNLTRDAARLLRVNNMGRLRKGAVADLVVWSHHPLEPGARVEQVYVGGQLVYSAKEVN